MALLTDLNIINPWSVFSLLLLAVWFIIYLTKPRLRREMLQMSLITAPFGLSEPVFIPVYWNPPSIFNLAENYHMDIEALVFCFAIGGIGSVLYEFFFNVEHQKLRRKRTPAEYRFGFGFHVFSIVSPIIIFFPIYFLSKINPIYIASFALLAGGVLGMICRPDLAKKIVLGGIMFLVLYFLIFVGFDQMFPGAIYTIWNLPAISGILLLGVPLEELMFAFTFGLMWSSAYEHVRNYRIIQVNKNY